MENKAPLRLHTETQIKDRDYRQLIEGVEKLFDCPPFYQVRHDSSSDGGLVVSVDSSFYETLTIYELARGTVVVRDKESIPFSGERVHNLEIFIGRKVSSARTLIKKLCRLSTALKLGENAK